MPCCAFAACLVAQLLLGVRSIRRAVFGGGVAEPAARNIAVEWQLDSVAPPLDRAPAFARRRLGRRSLRGLALAAALEVVIVAGAIYGVVEHFGHGAAHSGHAHRVEGVRLDLGTDASGAPAAAPSAG